MARAIGGGGGADAGGAILITSQSRVFMDSNRQFQVALARREAADFEAPIHERPMGERKQAHRNGKGGRRSRQMGGRKSRLRALWSPAMVNIEVDGDRRGGGVEVASSGGAVMLPLGRYRLFPLVRCPC